MSQTQCTRCIALKKNGAQCTRRTCKYSNMCWQHTKALKGLQIKPSGIRNAGLGLFTSKPFTNNQTIARFGGDIVMSPTSSIEHSSPQYSKIQYNTYSSVQYITVTARHGKAH